VTPVLHRQRKSVDSIQAVQAYYAFAEERLSYACGELPGSSLAFYGLGRTIIVPETRVAGAAGKAALYHRVALNIAPQNVLAGNELGVLFAQHGRLDEAEKLFKQCVAIQASPETYQNLRAVYARKGEKQAGNEVVTAGTAPATPDMAIEKAVSTAPAAEKPISASEPTATTTTVVAASTTAAEPQVEAAAKPRFVSKLSKLLRQ
jgi:hypothetical protein